MTTAAKTQRNISGTITDVAFKYVGTGANKGKEYAEVSLLEPGKDFPTKCRAFDEALVTRFKGPMKGTAIGLAIEESEGTINPHTKKPYTNRDIVAIVPVDAATAQAPAEGSQAAAPAAEGRSPLPRQEGGAAARKATALAPDPRGNSIERQTALIQATLLAANGVLVPGEDSDIIDAIEGAADRFIAWLQGTTAPDTGGAGNAPSTDTDDLPFDPNQEP